MAAGVQRLALAVLRQAFMDASDPGLRGVRARAWLTHDREGLRWWTICAGVSIREVRRRLAALETVPLSDDEGDDTAPARSVRAPHVSDDA